MTELVGGFLYKMANPQKENGYTPIANEILDALCRTRISGEARQVLDVIIRKTYGFNKKEDRIALSQLCSGTGLRKQTVCKATVKLVSMNLITKKGNDLGNMYKFNKDFDTWEPLPKKVTYPKKGIAVPKKGNNRTPKRDIQKTVSKDTITKDIGKLAEASTYGNADINKLIPLLKEGTGILDGTIAENRRYCWLLLLKLGYKADPTKAERSVEWVIKAARASPFHGKNATSFKYLYNHAAKIVQEAQTPKQTKMAIIK